MQHYWILISSYTWLPNVFQALDAEWLYTSSIIIFSCNTKHVIYTWVLMLIADTRGLMV